MQPLPETSKAIWEQVSEDALEAARHYERAEQLATEAKRAAEHATRILYGHESAAGIPRWQHLQTTLHAEECRLEKCRDHGRQVAALPYHEYAPGAEPEPSEPQVWT